MTGNSNYVNQETDNSGVAFSKTDHENNWKNNVNCHGCGLKGHQLKECNKTSSEDKKKIFAMKKAGNFEAKKTGVVDTVLEDTPSDDASAALPVTISGLEHNRYKCFLGVCGEDPVEILNIGEEEEFDENDAGFAFEFYNVGDISLANVEDEWTPTERISVANVANVGGVTFAEIEWNKQGQKGRSAKNKANPSRRHTMESTEGKALVTGKGSKRTLCLWNLCLDSCAPYHTFFSEEFLTDIEESNATMTGRCNASNTVTNMKGTYGDFQVWLNKKGISNLISIPMLEASG